MMYRSLCVYNISKKVKKFSAYFPVQNPSPLHLLNINAKEKQQHIKTLEPENVKKGLKRLTGFENSWQLIYINRLINAATNSDSKPQNVLMFMFDSRLELHDKRTKDIINK